MLTLTTDHWMIKYYTFIQKNLWRNGDEHINYKLGLGDKNSWTYSKNTRANFCEIARHVFLWPTLVVAIAISLLFALFVLPFIIGGLTQFIKVWTFISFLVAVFGGAFVVLRYIVMPALSKAKTKIGEIDTFKVYKKALKDRVCPIMKIEEVKEPVTKDQVAENIRKIEYYQNRTNKY